MTGVILGGNDPMLAIEYQIGIMIAIFTGTAITMPLAVLLSLHRSFSPYGTLRSHIFARAD
jgi:putative ABC transport system permease protein